MMSPIESHQLPGRNILVISAAQSYGSAVATITRVNPIWVVIVREHPGVPAPYLYAYHPQEILDRPKEWATKSVEDALGLHEYQASAVEAEGAIAPPIPGGSGGPASVRLVTLDVDGIPTGVKEPGATRSPGPTRGIRRGPMGGVSAGIVAPASTIDMQLAADGPSELNPGDVNLIEITAAAASDNLPLRNAVAATGSTTEKISVLISVLGDSIKVNGPKVLKIDPPAPTKPTQSAFEIEAVSEGLAQIAVIFRQGGSELANIKLKVHVKAGTLTATRVTANVVGLPQVSGAEGVLFLDVRRDTTASDIRYHYDLSCVRLGWDHLGFDSPRLLAPDGSAATSELAFVQRIYSAMTNKMLRTQSQVTQFAIEVEAFGEDLGAQLFPPDMIRALWDARSQIDSIRLMSWEAYIPWELVRLALPGPQPQSDSKFLSQYGMVRWLAGLSAPRELALKDWTYYAATYPNNPADDVTKEVAYLTTGLAKYNITPTHVASTYDAFAGTWQDGEFDVFHVACHGDVKDDNIEKAELVITDELVNGRPQLISISANVIGKIARLWPRRPLVFLNACEAGRLGESLTAWGGWPQKLIASGAGVVVGASWPVRDVASNKFAEAFYEALLAGQPLATAAAQARTAASASGDATWVSFKVFGDPHARIE